MAMAWAEVNRCRRVRRARDYDDDYVVKPPTKRSRRAPAKEADADHISDEGHHSGAEGDELEWPETHKVLCSSMTELTYFLILTQPSSQPKPCTGCDW